MDIPRIPAYVDPRCLQAKVRAMPFDPATLKYDAAGLIPCVAQDAASGEVLMVAWMNAASVAATLETGKVSYWSRSRGAFWVKGESSGHHQRLVELRVDCDRDCLLALVEQEGPACHTNRRSCFYTAVRDGEEVVFLDPVHGGHS
jgi:phosphoribosyl-AMP cyclohydrolase